MAGSKKGKKKKKNKGKKKKKKAKKIHPNLDRHDQESSSCGNSNNVNVVVDDSTTEEELEDLIYKKLKLASEEASSILKSLRYSNSTIEQAILYGGCFIGEKKYIISNILINAILYIETHPMVDGEYVFDEVPIYRNVGHLIRCWIQTLFIVVETVYLKDTPQRELRRRILACKSIDPQQPEGLDKESKIEEWVRNIYDDDEVEEEKFEKLNNLEKTSLIKEIMKDIRETKTLQPTPQTSLTIT